MFRINADKLTDKIPFAQVFFAFLLRFTPFKSFVHNQNETFLGRFLAYSDKCHYLAAALKLMTIYWIDTYVITRTWRPERPIARTI